jgi:hypothetical protein
MRALEDALNFTLCGLFLILLATLCFVSFSAVTVKYLFLSVHWCLEYIWCEHLFFVHMNANWWTLYRMKSEINLNDEVCYFLEGNASIPAEGHCRFGRTYCIHVQGRRVSQASSRQEAGVKPSNPFCPSFLLVTWLAYSPPKHRRSSIGLHGITSLKKIPFTWRVSSSGIWRRVVRWVVPDVSEERIASIFRIVE